eukprot:2979190-Amphidinium_carterae.1
MEVSLQIGREGLVGQKTLWNHDEVVNVHLQSCPGYDRVRTQSPGDTVVCISVGPNCSNSNLS